MNVPQRLLLGLILIAASFALLWWGSPLRAGAGQPEPIFAIAYVVVFGLGFVVAAMAILGMKADYPGFLSGVVLYFMVGAMVSVVLYVTGTEVGRISLEDAAHAEFWTSWVRVAATWPLEFVRRAELWGYEMLQFEAP